MSKLIACAFVSLFAASVAFAQAPTAAKAAPIAASDCAAKAIGKGGKPLSGLQRLPS